MGEKLWKLRKFHSLECLIFCLPGRKILSFCQTKKHIEAVKVPPWVLQKKWCGHSCTSCTVSDAHEIVSTNLLKRVCWWWCCGSGGCGRAFLMQSCHITWWFRILESRPGQYTLIGMKSHICTTLVGWMKIVQDHTSHRTGLTRCWSRRANHWRLTNYDRLPKTPIDMVAQFHCASLGSQDDNVEEILVLDISMSSSENVVKGDISYFVNCTDAAWTASSVLMDRLLSVSEGRSWIIFRAVEACPGYRNKSISTQGLLARAIANTEVPVQSPFF